MTAMLHIGTSGFSYDDWRGQWYPPDLGRGRYFDYYAERFGAVEINSTFYHIYAPRMMESLVRRAAGRVRFAVKMSEMVTHQGDLRRAVVRSYCAGIEPAAREGVLAAVLLQFPQRFHYHSENRQYLDRVVKAFGHYPLVVEIRHRSWQRAEAMRYIEDRNLSLCMMDMPRMSGLPQSSLRLTGPIAYVRFHGRNGGQWYGEAYPGGRYDYYYSREELEQWVEPVEALERKADSALAFFNNHVAGKAPANAEMFLEYFGQRPGKPSYRDLASRGLSGGSGKRAGGDGDQNSSSWPVRGGGRRKAVVLSSGTGRSRPARRRARSKRAASWSAQMPSPRPRAPKRAS